MNNVNRIVMVGTIATMLSLSACMWNHEGRGDRARDRSQERSSDSHRTDRDRDGRSCDEHRQDGDNRRDDDCRPSRP
jgi:hypothetical protein